MVWYLSLKLYDGIPYHNYYTNENLSLVLEWMNLRLIMDYFITETGKFKVLWKACFLKITEWYEMSCYYIFSP